MEIEKLIKYIPKFKKKQGIKTVSEYVIPMQLFLTKFGYDPQKVIDIELDKKKYVFKIKVEE